VQERDPFILGRDQAYIGVLIDDLITKGTQEPYRMFTSRAEFRLLLRQDNADIRLTPMAHALGMIGDDMLEKVNMKVKATQEMIGFLRSEGIPPELANPVLEAKDSSPINQQVKMSQLLTRPHISMNDVFMMSPEIEKKANALTEIHADSVEQAEILVKYEGYLAREQEMADKHNRLEDVSIPADFEYLKLESMSFESREKLTKIRPATIGQASRISGVSPSDISVILIHLGR
jgi:tRNA uridine 5-carboxymethylaminomethyl modification enzyme